MGRWVVVAALLAGCDMGDQLPEPETPEACVAAGGKVRQAGDGLYCDLPGSGGYAVAAKATARPDDGGSD